MLSFSSIHHGCKLFTKDDLSPIVLPCFFSNFLTKNLIVYAINKNNILIENQIEKTTSTSILNRLEQFLHWLEFYSNQSEFVSIETHQNLPSELLNNYVNNILIEENSLGEASVKQSIQALTSYYNYLYHTGIIPYPKVLRIRPALRNTARSNTKKRTSVKYFTPELRNILYHNTESIRDELLLRTGGECGLRSKENQGFLLNDFRIGTKTHKGLLSLFEDMEDNPEKSEFEYYLQGRFSKAKRHSGGSSRKVYIHSDLLRRFKEYYEMERPESDSDSFFLNDSNSTRAKPIAAARATKIFNIVRNKVMLIQEKGLLPAYGQLLEKGHTHHILRHSFATDKFYFFSKQWNIAIDNVTTTSQVYLAVAALLGHSGSSKSAPTTTKNYIRSCHIKESFEASEEINDYRYG
ncbi:phage integrase family protein [Psychromonas ingrahamii 37]|uniref:Phage integrase family protein n=1 Tax=Psychromonas ingrahamii (strain DSM 17664 / CCUG 51855 / 37) TaxID=357804 RepID=A1SRA8_PSYIN|nr:site-specific integrase [Psychromonas ingrahamii]ABM02023.1 phage integrase family protein [Psychromonas ingrahamii 37]